jgi:DNA anti-recombination protein RmuC
MNIKSIMQMTRIALMVAMLMLPCATISFASHHEESKTTATEVKQKAAETYEALKNYTLEQQDEAVAAAEKKLTTLDEQIDVLQNDLDARWQTMSQTTREKTREIIRKLNKEREDVAEWYGGMRHSSAEAWEEVKKGFADSYDRLERAFQDAKKDFDKDK